MTDDSKETKPATEPAKTQTSPPVVAPAGADEGLAEALFPADAEIALLTARVAELEGEKTNLIDRLLRAQAEMDNYRKRTEREREETAKYAVTRFAQDIAGVVDNFERAAAAVPAGAAERDATLKSFHDGILLAEREFLNVLERHGVKRIDAQGQPFDPHRHQAVMEREDAAVPAGTVLQVFQAGYMIEDRCLRPAMVVVSRGGPKQPKSAPAAAAETATVVSSEPVAEPTPPEVGRAAAADPAGPNGETPEAETEVAEARPEGTGESPAEQPGDEAGGSRSD